MSVQSADAIRAQLRKVLESKTFVSAEKMCRFLKFTVERTLSVPDESIKEIVIGMELYSSGADFDPRLSAAVRVDATRVRAKLREYYDSEGAADDMIIDLPRGSYTPVFRATTVPSTVNTNAAVNGEQRDAEPSIAVLPFSNLSPEPGDYFSDGLTEEVIHALSSVPGLRVVARTSCFAMKHRNADVRDVGRALNVDFVLEGSVRRSGEALRVNVQLVKATDGYQLWSSRYDRRIHDVFAVQDEIAQEIVTRLRGGAPAEPSASRGATFEAYVWYLRGRYHLNRQTRESFHRAIGLFEEALAHSEDYGAALSGAAVARLYLGLFSMDRPLEVIRKARSAAVRAIDIKPDDGEALSVAACAEAILEWNWLSAEKLFRRALNSHPPSDLSKHLFVMYFLLPMARLDEALEMLDEARRIDPLSLFVSASRTAVLLMARRPAEAEAECRRALELDPEFWRAIVALGRCYEMQGQYEAAIACYERAKLISDRVPSAIGALGCAYALAGRKAKAYEILDELEQLAQHRYVSPYGRVLVFLGLGDERVFDWLERSYEERAGWLMYLATDPRFDRLREDRRFRSFLQKLNLPLIGH